MAVATANFFYNIDPGPCGCFRSNQVQHSVPLFCRKPHHLPSRTGRAGAGYVLVTSRTAKQRSFDRIRIGGRFLDRNLQANERRTRKGCESIFDCQDFHRVAGFSGLLEPEGPML